jgi:transposase
MAVANKIIEEIDFVNQINQAITWDRAHWNISPGGLAKMLVMGTFTDMRIPLTRITERFKSINVNYFLTPQDKSDDLNEFNVGKALDRIAEKDYEQIYQTIALSAIQKYQIPLTQLHSDTTTISFYGEYDLQHSLLTEEEIKTLFKIEKGYNKDNRPQSKQVVVGQITNQIGIPIVNKVQSGATNDIDWNRQALNYLQQIRAKGFQVGLYVADSKLMTQEHVTRMNTSKERIAFVSRCPANFADRLESQMISRAYDEGGWVEYGSFSEAKDACTYRGVGFTKTFYGASLRLVVLESSSLVKNVECLFEKQQRELELLIKKLIQPVYSCQKDAEVASKRFLALKQTRLFLFDIDIVEHVQEVWPKGRRGSKTQPKIKTTCQIVLKNTRRNDEAYRVFEREQSCFVLVSNVVDRSDREVVLAYKGQFVVENSFRLLKSPQVGSVVYLKDPRRIGVLSMLLVFALLVRAFIEYRLREGLRIFRERSPKRSLRAGWSGRELASPTFKLLYEHAYSCFFEYEGVLEGYGFCWPRGDAQVRVGVLLDLFGYTLEQLVE